MVFLLSWTCCFRSVRKTMKKEVCKHCRSDNPQLRWHKRDDAHWEAGWTMCPEVLQSYYQTGKKQHLDVSFPPTFCPYYLEHVVLGQETGETWKGKSARGVLWSIVIMAGMNQMKSAGIFAITSFVQRVLTVFHMLPGGRHLFPRGVDIFLNS